MDISKLYGLVKPDVSSNNKTDSTSGFKQIFDRTLDEINATPAVNAVDDKMNVIEQGDKILNLLDDYARQLTDPRKTLKDIEPLVDRIENEVHLIEAQAATKVHDDHELETIIKDLSITANVAVLKFQRGDYI